MELDLVAVVELAILVILLLHVYVTYPRWHLESLRIPIVKPFFWFGSPPFDIHNHHIHELHHQRFQKFGKTYGWCEGLSTGIVTIDTEIIKAVQVKHFSFFSDVTDLNLSDSELTLDLAGGEKWRSLRKILSPTFTSGKLKEMMEPMGEVADMMMNHVQELYQTSPILNMKTVFQEFAMNAIAKCAFGIETNAHLDPDQDLIKYGNEAISDILVKSWMDSIIYQLFFIIRGIERFISIYPPGMKKISAIVTQIIRSREDSNVSGKDFLARLIEMKQSLTTNTSKVEGLSEELITTQGVLFLLAGYETTSNTLSTFVYSMATNIEAQERVYEEIVDVLANHDGVVDANSISDMEYLEAAINENLRMFPPVTEQYRICNQDWEVIPGIHLKKGMRVKMPIYASHYHPEYFPDPHQFQPERFLKANQDQLKPYTFRPFGGGPRICLGQRFAMTEIKIILAKLLLAYRIVSAPDTKLEFSKGNDFMLNFPEMIVKLVKRD